MQQMIVCASCLQCKAWKRNVLAARVMCDAPKTMPNSSLALNSEVVTARANSQKSSLAVSRMHYHSPLICSAVKVHTWADPLSLYASSLVLLATEALQSIKRGNDQQLILLNILSCCLIAFKCQTDFEADSGLCSLQHAGSPIMLLQAKLST